MAPYRTQSTINRRNFLGGISAGALAATAGCVEGPNLDAVALQITDVRVPSIGSNSLTLPLVLELNNTGSTDISDCNANFDLYINAQRVASTSETIGDLPAQRVKSVLMEVFISYNALGGQLLNAFRVGRFNLALDGELTANGMLPFLNATRTFRLEGRVG